MIMNSYFCRHIPAHPSGHHNHHNGHTTCVRRYIVQFHISTSPQLLCSSAESYLKYSVYISSIKILFGLLIFFQKNKELLMFKSYLPLLLAIVLLKQPHPICLVCIGTFAASSSNPCYIGFCTLKTLFVLGLTPLSKHFRIKMVYAYSRVYDNPYSSASLIYHTVGTYLYHPCNVCHC